MVCWVPWRSVGQFLWSVATMKLKKSERCYKIPRNFFFFFFAGVLVSLVLAVV